MSTSHAASEKRNWKKYAGTGVVMTALAFVPLIYSSILTDANIDPTGNLDTVPAAVVNEDTGATDPDGEALEAGDELTDTLTSSDEKNNFDWAEMSAADAQQSLEDGDVYAVLTIPKDFSSNVVSVGDDDANLAAPAKLTVQTNDGLNMISGNIASTIGDAVTNTLRGEVSSQYLEKIYLGFSDVHSSLTDAADGAKQLADGTDTAKDGSGELVIGLDQLRDGTLQLQDGAATLAAGADTAAQGSSDLSAGLDELHDKTSALPDQSAQLDDGAHQVADGAKQLQAGTGELSDRVDQAVSELTPQLDKAGEVADRVSDVLHGADQLADDAKTVKNGVDEVKNGVDDLKNSADELGLGSLSGDVNNLPDEIQNLFDDYQNLTPQERQERLQSLMDSVDNVRTGIDDVKTGAEAIRTKASQIPALDELGSSSGDLADALDQLGSRAGHLGDDFDQAVSGVKDKLDQAGQAVDGIHQLRDGADQLADGANQVADGTALLAEQSVPLANGIAQAADGASQLKDGNAQLADGAHALSEGTLAAASGTTQALDGANQLDDGLGQLKDGSAELHEGLEDGIDEVPNYTGNEAKHLSTVAADQVTIDAQRVNEVAGYGAGLAPYFLSLALWVGGMSFYMIAASINAKALARRVPFPLLSLRSMLPGAIMGVIQSAIAVFSLHFWVGVQAVDLPGLFLLAAFASVTFLVVNQGLVSLLGSPGRFIALLMVVLQVASSGGTYPIETAPHFFQVIHHFLPMTYTVEAFRSQIAGGSIGISTAYGALSIWLLAGVVLSMAAAVVHLAKERRADIDALPEDESVATVSTATGALRLLQASGEAETQAGTTATAVLERPSDDTQN